MVEVTLVVRRPPLSTRRRLLSLSAEPLPKFIEVALRDEPAPDIKSVLLEAKLPSVTDEVVIVTPLRRFSFAPFLLDPRATAALGEFTTRFPENVSEFPLAREPLTLKAEKVTAALPVEGPSKVKLASAVPVPKLLLPKMLVAPVAVMLAPLANCKVVALPRATSKDLAT